MFSKINNIIQARDLSVILQLSSSKIVQLFLTLIRNKLIIVLFGTSGFGVSTLINAYIELGKSFFKLGIDTSGVKFVAASTKSNTSKRVFQVVSLCAVSSLGCLLLYLISEFIFPLFWVSLDLPFPNWLAPLFVSFAVLDIGLKACLQGLGNIKAVYQDSIKSSISSFLIGSLSMILLGITGIYIFIGFAIISSLFLSILSCKRTLGIRLSDARFILEKSGAKAIFSVSVFVFSASILQNTLQFYFKDALFRIDSSILGTYSSVIFTAQMLTSIVLVSVGADFFVRLQKTSQSSEVPLLLQKEITKLNFVLYPALISCAIFSQELLSLLYSKNVATYYSCFSLALFGAFIRANFWPFRYLFLTRPQQKKFMLTVEGLEHIIFVLLGLLLFQEIGLMGVAIAYAISQTFALATYSIIAYKTVGIVHLNFRFILRVSTWATVLLILFQCNSLTLGQKGLLAIVAVGVCLRLDK